MTQNISVCVSRRPQIDEKLLRAYLLLGARDADLSAMLGVSISTMRRLFGPTLIKVRAERRTNIRKMVWEKAKDGNTALLIWLAKNELEPTEEIDGGQSPRQRKRINFQRFAEEFQREFQTTHDVGRNARAESVETDGSG